MKKRLPPLNAIRAFEVAARHLSFTKAAQEMNVTQVAVSRQIKLLEDVIGVALFKRRNNLILLTDAGQIALPSIREAFEQLASAFERIESSSESSMVHITTAPGFAAQWLAPRLERFTASHPGIQIRIDASTEILDLKRENIDLCIRFGNGVYPGLTSEPFLRIDLVPVCSPSLLGGSRPLKEPRDLKWRTLLQIRRPTTDDSAVDWRRWLSAARVHEIDPDIGPQFNEMGVAIRAAIAGHGVLLGRSALVEEELSSGRLVKPFDLSVRNPDYG